MNHDQFAQLLQTMTVVGQDGVRRWNVSQDVVDPFDFELAGEPVPDAQVDAFLNWQLDRIDAGEDL